MSATLAPAALVSPWDDGLILALWPTTSDDVEDVLQRAARIAARNTPDPLPRALELQWVHESVTVPGDAAELHRSVGRLDAKLGLAAAESPPQPLRPESEPVGSGT